MLEAAVRAPSRGIDMMRALSFRMQRQRLDQRTPESAQLVATEVGYVPSPGGGSPYIAFLARSPRLDRRAVDLAVFNAGSLIETPFARRSAVLAPEADAPFLRAVASPSHLERARPLLDAGLVDESKRRRLAEELLVSLARGPLSADELRSKVPASCFVSFGEAGRKAGLPSLFSLVLLDLWLSGQVRRRPREQRLDREAFVYSPMEEAAALPDRPLALAHLARRYFHAYAPATLSGFAFWTDSTLTEARAAIRRLELVEVRIEGQKEPALVPPEIADELHAFDAPSPGRLAFVPFRDPYLCATKDLRPLLPAAHVEKKFADWRGRLVAAGGGSAVHQHFLLEGGYISGVWAYDAASKRVEFATFEPMSTRAMRRAEDAANQLAEVIARDLGALRYYADDERAETWGRLSETAAHW